MGAAFDGAFISPNIASLKIFGQQKRHFPNLYMAQSSSATVLAEGDTHEYIDWFA